MSTINVPAAGTKVRVATQRRGETRQVRFVGIVVDCSTDVIELESYGRVFIPREDLVSVEVIR